MTTPTFPDETAHVQVLAQPAPRHVAEARSADVARSLYPGATEFAYAVPDKAFDGADMPQQARDAAVVELRQMFADTGMSPADAAQLMGRASAVRHDGKSADEQRREARSVLRGQFSDTDADAALADARALVNRDPRFKRFVELRGIGNDPESILILARAARSLRVTRRG